MISSQQLAQIVSKVVKSNQSHILTDINDLSEQELTDYCDQLNQIDFNQIKTFQKIINKEVKINQINDNQIQPIEQLLTLDQQSSEMTQELQNIGLQAIAKGELAIITLAGGQGTRLGFDLPKGMFKVNLHSQKSLFQLFAERINCLNKLSLLRFPQEQQSSGIQWYLMTSKQTDSQTKQFFKENNNFGIHENNIHFFQQGYIPSFDKNGQILFENKNQIFLSPNGNGGVYESLKNRNILQQLNDQKIKYVHMVGIDNILSKLGDPVQLGLMISKNFEIVSKYVQKKNADECVGVHVLNNGKPSIIEYSDLTAHQRNEKTQEGKLRLNEGFICNFMCQTSFLNRIINVEDNINQLLAYHQAFKLVPYYDASKQEMIHPQEKNAHKFELFIFDAFPLAESFGLMEVNREQEFAPIKNNEKSSNVDTPLTALELVSKLHRQWMVQAGYVVDFEASGENVFEVDSNLSYFGEGIQNPKDENKHIKEKGFYLKQ